MIEISHNLFLLLNWLIIWDKDEPIWMKRMKEKNVRGGRRRNGNHLFPMPMRFVEAYFPTARWAVWISTLRKSHIKHIFDGNRIRWKICTILCCFFFIACACFQIACWFLLIVNSSLMHTRDARALACVDSYGAKRLTTNRSVRAIETTIHSGDSKLLCLTMHCMACRWMAERRTDARGNALLYCIE